MTSSLATSAPPFPGLVLSAHMRTFRLRFNEVAGIALPIFALAACSGTPRQYEDPIAAMTDPNLTIGANVEAMRQAAVVAPDDPKRITALKDIMSQPGSSLEMRTTALQLLLDHDQADARKTLMYRLPSINDWDFMEHACAQIGSRSWTEFTPALVRSLARPMPLYERIEDRPEYAALEDLHPGQDAADIIFEFVAQPTTSEVMSQWRLSAWDLLNRMDVDPARLGDLLASADPASDRMLADLKACAVELHIVPETRQEVEWLQAIRTPESAEWWAQCRMVADLVPPLQRTDLQLRHLAVLIAVAHSHPDWLARSRGDLFSDIAEMLRDRPLFRVRTDTAYTASHYNATQKLADCADQLTWPDLLTIRLALDMFADSQTISTIFAQSADDHRDTLTEYGGVIDCRDGQWEALAFPPRLRAGDSKFLAPPALEERGHTALFHYHFHVQDKDNRDYAGPGVGDREYAEAMGVNCLVFTSVGDGQLNVDFYQRGGVVVDLGVIYR